MNDKRLYSNPNREWGHQAQMQCREGRRRGQPEGKLVPTPIAALQPTPCRLAAKVKLRRRLGGRRSIAGE